MIKLGRFELLLVCFLMANFVFSYAANDEEGGLVPVICVYKPLPYRCIKIESSLSLEALWNRPDSEWEVTSEGISKGYTYHRGTKITHGWEHSAGQIFYLDIGFHPWKKIIGGLGIEAIGSYADTLWLPINDEHRMHADKQNVKWVRGELKYLEKNRFMARYFKGIGHYHWGYEGDMFNLFPESYIPNTYRRITGKCVPEGGEFTIQRGTNKLTVISGPRLVWGGGESTLAKYNFRIGRFDSALIYKDEKINWGGEDKYLHIGELSTRTSIIKDFPFQVGLFYKPFRVGREYNYIKEVALGTGYAGSEYLIKKGRTDFFDAWAVKTKVNTEKSAPYIDESSLTYTYAGLVAGNKNEVTLQFDKKLSRLFYTSSQFTYRQPLIGPMPFLREGTDENPGPVWSTPRGQDSPFWISQDNRKATICSLFLTYDPTPSTWFYQWEPNNLQEWNLNPKENAKLSFGLGYTLSYFPTTTDLQTYIDSEGNTVWEPITTHGRWATKKPLSFITLLSKINLPQSYKFLIALRTGEELSDGVFSYTMNQEACKPIAGFLNTAISMEKDPYLATVAYQQGRWGPEDWHRTFGQTFDRLFRISLERSFGEFKAGVEYLGTREVDGKYITSMIGAIDEIRLYCMWRFSAFFKPPSLYPPPDTTPPQLSIEVLKARFSPNGDGIDDTTSFRLMTSDESGIEEWRLEILNQEGHSVKLFSRKGKPPSLIDWDGMCDYPKEVVPEGTYTCVFEVKDKAGNSATAPSVTVNVEIPKIELPKEIKITKEKEGLKVTITSKVLFDINRSLLKKSAYRVLNRVGEILSSYPENKLRVEGHADSVGRASYNQRLSELRARSVADYLIQKCGISPSRMKVLGYGEMRPVASNATREGRTKNRRVEIIILKLEKESKE